MRFLIIVNFVLLAAAAAPAAEYAVYPDGSGTYPTIQAAVDAAVAGDLIYLMPGTFTGPGNRDVVIDVPLTIRSNDVFDPVVIDCQGSAAEPHRAFTLNDEPITLAYLVIRNGFADDGGAVDGLFSTPTFDHCGFEDNTATGAGGAVHHAGENVAVFNSCVFAGNEAGLEGGAVAAGTGVQLQFTSCTLVRNHAPMGGTVFYGTGTHCQINQSIIAFGSGGAAIEDFYGSGLVVGCTDIYGNRGGDWAGPASGQLGPNNNVSVDPLLCDPRGIPANYAVMGASPVAYGFACGFLGAKAPDMSWPAPVYSVAADGKGMYATIQAAVLAVPAGAGIALEDGTFTGLGNRDLYLYGKTVDIHSASGDPSACVVDCQGSEADIHVFLSLEQNETGVVVEGIGVTGGYWVDVMESRGVIQSGPQSDLTIRNCVFTGNAAAVRAMGPDSDVTLDGCRFVANGRPSSVDAGVTLAHSAFTIAGCSFEDAIGPELTIWQSDAPTTATISGCTFHESGSPNASWATVRIARSAASTGLLDVTVSGCEFLDAATQSLALTEVDGAVIEDCTFAGSGASALNIYCYATGRGSHTVRGCTFTDNYSGLGASGVDLLVEDSSFDANDFGLTQHGGSLDLRGCTFTGNGQQLPEGGALHTTDTDVVASGTSFADNGSADLSGFCIELYGSTGSVTPYTATFSGCDFVGNRTAGGGAIHATRATDLSLVDCLLTGNTANYYGSAIMLSGTEHTVLDGCTLHKNAIGSPAAFAPYRGQIHVSSTTEVPAPVVDLTHTLITRGIDCAAVWGVEGPVVTATTCDIHANDLGDYVGLLEGQWGLTGNFAVNPLYCDPWDAGAGLNEASVCLPANNDHGVQIGARGVACYGLADTPDDAGDQLPRVFAVAGNHPNPFNPRTVIGFELPAAGPVTVVIHDLSGRIVRTLAAGVAFPAGAHQVAWDGTDERGAAQSSGVYLYRVTAQGQTLGGKMALIR